MEIHSDSDCENLWRQRISDNLERETYLHFSTGDATDQERWFQEGIRYAIMMIRWDMCEE